MWGGDRARKETLVEYGFRLPSAIDNRPLSFDEFEGKLTQGEGSDSKFPQEQLCVLPLAFRGRDWTDEVRN